MTPFEAGILGGFLGVVVPSALIVLLFVLYVYWTAAPSRESAALDEVDAILREEREA